MLGFRKSSKESNKVKHYFKLTVRYDRDHNDTCRKSLCVKIVTLSTRCDLHCVHTHIEVMKKKSS